MDIDSSHKTGAQTMEMLIVEYFSVQQILCITGSTLALIFVRFTTSRWKQKVVIFCFSGHGKSRKFSLQRKGIKTSVDAGARARNKSGYHDDTFMLRRSLDRDVHALIDEQIKWNFLHAALILGSNRRARLKCKFKSTQIRGRREKNVKRKLLNE